MTESVSERPTMAEAFASDVAGADPLPADPSTAQTPAVPASADATVPPADATAEVPPATAPSGEPPKERWADILQNTRTKTRAEVEAEFHQRLGWAEAIDPSEVAQLQRWSESYRADPVRWM